MQGSYWILDNQQQSLLANEVLFAQARGWEPIGGVCVVILPHYQSAHFYQAIVHKKAFTEQEIRKQLGV